MDVKVCAAGVAVALGVAALVFTAGETAAKGGPGIKPWHSAKPWALHHRRAFRRAAFGGFVTGYWPSYDPGYGVNVIADGPRSQRLDPYLPPAGSLACQRSQQIVTVPSETGGERRITITRC